jgi:drug/metabolite transporter (DMT)-like permease
VSEAPAGGAVRERPPIPPALALVTAVAAVSWGGPLVRFTAAPALAVAAWRLTIAVAFIALVLLVRGRPMPRLARSDWFLAAVSGVFLAVHFWTWIASLDLTTVSSSVVLVSTQPVFVALLSGVFLAERATARQWAGILVAVAGAAVIAWGDFGLGRDALIGDALAIAGAFFVSVYFVIGRRLRARIDLWWYIGIVYGIAAVVLLAAASLMPGVSLVGYGTNDWLVFAALAAGPMMLGHTGLNYALRYVRAYVANLAVLGEPVGATLIAWLLPAIGEVPGPQLVAGGALILGGIALTVLRAEAGRSGPAAGVSTGGRAAGGVMGRGGEAQRDRPGGT